MALNKTKMEFGGVPLEVSRKGSGPPLLLLHGGGGPMMGLPFTDKLAKNFEIIAPTHPGFGGSPIPENFDNLQDLVFLYLDLMDALELEDAVMMGCSMGGWTAAELAVINTRRLAKLILVDAVGIKPGGREDRDIADVFALPPEEVTRLMWHDPAKAPNPADWSDEELEVAAASRVALALYTWQPYMHNPKLPHRLHRIDVPTLLIWGESDGLVTPAYGEAYRAMIPGAQLTLIPEAGHSPQTEQADAFVSRVLDFAG